MLLFLIVGALIGACASTSSPPTKGVTFTIRVPTEEFSPSAALQVGVWNAQQLRQLDRQAECVVSVDMETQAETTLCPDGVHYQKITPEEFVFPIQSIKQSVQFTSQTVKVGEKYQIVLRGMSSDNCNTTSAMAEGTAASSSITLASLAWQTTEMACVQP